jgi:hypothetical protein
MVNTYQLMVTKSAVRKTKLWKKTKSKRKRFTWRGGIKDEDLSLLRMKVEGRE